MKRFLVVFCCLFSLLVNAAEDQSIHIRPDQKTLKITLPANPTTGYQWQLEDYDESIVTFVSQRYEPPKTQLMGAGGQSIFTFNLANRKSLPKSTELIFHYLRVWDPGSATKTNVKLLFD